LRSRNYYKFYIFHLNAMQWIKSRYGTNTIATLQEGIISAMDY